jgi:hypothetical protein
LRDAPYASNPSWQPGFKPGGAGKAASAGKSTSIAVGSFKAFRNGSVAGHQACTGAS